MDFQLSLEDDPILNTLRRTFDRAKQRVLPSLPKLQYDKFIKPLEVEGREEHLIFITAPGKFIQEWVRDKYRKQLEEALSHELGEPIEIVIEARLQERKPQDHLFTTQVAPTVKESPPCYSFDNFVIGTTNQIAYNGALKICEKPGTYCNPLFIYGPTGVGKTHLLCATSNELRKRHPGLPVRYMTAQEFASGFIQSLEKNSLPSYRRALENVGAWLVDDVGFLEGKNKTQEEMFFIFNFLLQNGKQIVLSAERPPRDLTKIEERLRTRFESALVAEIQPPDTTTRIEILKRKADQEGIEVPDEVVEYLAVNTPGRNVRTMLGAFTTLMVHHSITKRPLDIQFVEEIIRPLFGSFPSTPTGEEILKAVSNYYSVSMDQLTGPTRKAWIAHARHVAIYLCREVLNESWQRLGARFGGRDHSSIMHAYQKVTTLIGKEERIRSEISNIKKELNL